MSGIASRYVGIFILLLLPFGCSRSNKTHEDPPGLGQLLIKESISVTIQDAKRVDAILDHVGKTRSLSSEEANYLVSIAKRVKGHKDQNVYDLAIAVAFGCAKIYPADSESKRKIFALATEYIGYGMDAGIETSVSGTAIKMFERLKDPRAIPILQKARKAARSPSYAHDLDTAIRRMNYVLSHGVS